jgi:hypothetical protein
MVFDQAQDIKDSSVGSNYVWLWIGFGKIEYV